MPWNMTSLTSSGRSADLQSGTFPDDKVRDSGGGIDCLSEAVTAEACSNDNHGGRTGPYGAILSAELLL